jgi:ABC-type multidrug transport system fused ATPase/permease subunit
MGFVGEAGRKKFNALSKERRLAVVKEALTQKQIVQLGEVQGKTFSGVMSTLQDAVQRFVGAVGIPLFKALSEQIQKLNKWVGENQVKLAAVAATIGDVLLGAFQAIIASVQYFMDHGDEFLAILIAIGSVITGFAVAWAISFAPIIAIIALIAALVFVVIKIVRNWDLIKSKGVAAWNAVKKAASDAWEFIKDIPSKILDGFEALGNGIISTLGKAFDWIVQQAKDLPGKILDHLRKIPGFGAIESAANIVAGGIPVAGGGVAAEAISRVQESQAPAGAVSTVNIGDINVTAPIGADAKEHADIIKTHITKHLESEYRRSAP